MENRDFLAFLLSGPVNRFWHANRAWLTRGDVGKISLVPETASALLGAGVEIVIVLIGQIRRQCVAVSCVGGDPSQRRLFRLTLERLYLNDQGLIRPEVERLVWNDDLAIEIGPDCHSQQPPRVAGECRPLVQWEADMTAEVVDAIPLSKDANGVYRIGGTRVTLDLVVRAFNRGATPEEIAQDFPSLRLPDIYQVIGYYLKHGSELAE